MSQQPGFAAIRAGAVCGALLGTLSVARAWAGEPGQAAPPATSSSAKLHAHKPTPAADTAYAAHLSAGRFGSVAVYIPEGPPQSVAVFLSGDGGWELGVVNMAHALTALGAVVIGADIRNYLASLKSAAQRAGAPCQMIAADFESLSHQVQKEIGMSEYHVPVLIGYSS
ncbi:MAG TPA: AcvB/VirJ family lysyl-phosphatidylglycerol hydrolase, partial [Steroidobacteraceae bacterium]|nr:AcvB/VirJ family lysyl-phosphatidylglycerol hydrolase [Steroidobacteraceae bacterium]